MHFEFASASTPPRWLGCSASPGRRVNSEGDRKEEGIGHPMAQFPVLPDLMDTEGLHTYSKGLGISKADAQLGVIVLGLLVTHLIPKHLSHGRCRNLKLGPCPGHWCQSVPHPLLTVASLCHSQPCCGHHRGDPESHRAGSSTWDLLTGLRLTHTSVHRRYISHRLPCILGWHLCPAP